jgi:hypothetical protein
MAVEEALKKLDSKKTYMRQNMRRKKLAGVEKSR